MAKKPRRTVKKQAYHHGDLERALVDTAVRVIQDEGIAALTLRDVGARLGVSRTALYRHFDDKAALLARVASEGFRLLSATLAAALENAAAAGEDPLPAMAAAYVHFARANPSHYQTMFSGVLTDGRQDPDLQRHGEAAFNVLLNTIRRGQDEGRIRTADPVELAAITRALSHGIATLGMANQLTRTPAALEELAVHGCAVLQRGMQKK